MNLSGSKINIDLDGVVYCLIDGDTFIEVIIGLDGCVSSESNIKEVCDCCGFTDCYFDCVDSKESLNGDQDAAQDYREDVNDRCRFNNAVDGAEAFLMALAGNNVDIHEEPIIDAFFASIEGIANNV